ncbi:MAG: hypothetical protein ACKVG2_06745 [Candidatus Poseidoniales archaeon]|jgi:hypothetical protein
MWLYISGGFLSIVAHRGQPMHLLVRARHPEHIGALFPDLELTIMPTADYPFRVVVHRTVVQRALAQYVMTMEYDNFKNSIADEPYHDVCLDVWTTMWKYGLREGGV